MPQNVSNLEIIDYIKESEAERASINAAVELLNKRRDDFERSPEAEAIKAEDAIIAGRSDAYREKVRILKDSMDKAYGYGNWQDLDIKEFTFLTRAELEADPEWKRKHYILANPDIKEKVEVDDIKVIESEPEPKNV